MIKEIGLRYIRLFTDVVPDWNWLSKDTLWKQHLINVKNNHQKKVLICTMTGSNWACSSFESLLGIALSLKGVSVDFLLCDGSLPSCQECEFERISPKIMSKFGPKPILCNSCFNPAFEMLKKTQLSILKLSDYFNNKSFTKIETILSENVKAGILRYYGVGDLNNEIKTKKIIHRYLKAEYILKEALQNISKKFNHDIIILHHGIYVPQGVIVEHFKRKKKQIVTWGPSYKKSTVLFSHDSSYHYTMPKEKINFDQIHLSKQNRNQILNYLKSREKGSNDWISFHNEVKKNIHQFENLSKKYKKIAGLFTNVIWDAQLHFKDSAFKTMLDWLWYTIDFFIKHEDYCLIIRIHPAEITGTVKSRQPILNEIKKRYISLPSNIIVIEPNDKISSYEISRNIDIALIYGTKMGIEIATLGIPIIVAGDSWIKGKGFSIDPKNKNEYLNILNNLQKLKKLNYSQKNKAIKYAYYVFFKKMIYIDLLEPLKRYGLFKINVKNLDQIKSSKGLNKIIESILHKKNFTN